MMSRLHLHVRRNLVAYLALATAVAATGGVAYSAIPDANSVIHGCYDTASGALRVIDTEASGTCRGGETALDWNQKGQPGATGAQRPPGLATTYCVMLHNERRLASTIFGCTVEAGTSSDLGRANLIAGANQLKAFQTVSANVLHTFQAASNKISLTCLQYAGGKWPARITNARLIAMKVDQINPLNAFRAISIKIPKAKRKPTLRATP